MEEDNDVVCEEGDGEERDGELAGSRKGRELSPLVPWSLP